MKVFGPQGRGYITHKQLEVTFLKCSEKLFWLSRHPGLLISHTAPQSSLAHGRFISLPPVPLFPSLHLTFPSLIDFGKPDSSLLCWVFQSSQGPFLKFLPSHLLISRNPAGLWQGQLFQERSCDLKKRFPHWFTFKVRKSVKYLLLGSQNS